jgi:hypothetical protein
VLGVTAELVERLGIEIAKIWMLAQDRKLAARKRPSFTRLILSHAGYNSKSGAGEMPAPLIGSFSQ